MLWSHSSMSLSTGLPRLLALIFVLVTTWIFVRSYISFNMKTIRLPRWMGEWGSLLGKGLQTRAMGHPSIPPPSPDDPEDGQIWQGGACLWDPKHVG